MIPLPTTPLPTALFVTDPESLEEVTELVAPVTRAAERLRLATETADAEKARALGELRHALLHLGCKVVEDGRYRAELARVLYWGHPEIPVRDIVPALGFADQRALAAAAGPFDTGVACKRCARSLVAWNRSGLADIQKESAGRGRPWSRSLVCDPCREAQARAEVEYAADPWPDEEWERDWPGDGGYLDPAA